MHCLLWSTNQAVNCFFVFQIQEGDGTNNKGYKVLGGEGNQIENFWNKFFFHGELYSAMSCCFQFYVAKTKIGLIEKMLTDIKS